MNGYPIALFFHLCFVMLATAAASVNTAAALRLRRANGAPEALALLEGIERMARLFPVSVLGLLITGGYMTRANWSWTTPWIVTAIAGLVAIVALGAGLERGRGMALKRELWSAGMSGQARRLLRDPVAWTARMTTWGLVVGVVFAMTAKPGVEGCVSAMLVAVGAGALSAVPMWRASAAEAPAADGATS